ncbi:MAG: SMP-30/gluconolactonase/LRE family protein [Rhodanobacter sp.]
MWLVLIILVVAVVLYLLMWPTQIKPVLWRAPPAPSLVDGPYRVNDRLRELVRIGDIGGVGPEGIATDAEGRIYAGYLDGRVVRFDADGNGHQLLANTGGRPFGMMPQRDGGVLVCDGIRGLLRIDAAGSVEVLSSQAEGVPYRFTNDLDVDASGTVVYFSDSSHKWGVCQDIDDIIEHAGNGRLMRHDLTNGETTVLLRGLQFPNGVAVGPNGDYVLVAESGQYQVQRYWLKGPKAGSADLFIDNLPGFPDNISYNGRDRFWLAIAAPRNALLDGLSGNSFIRTVISRLPAFIQPKPTRHSIVLALDPAARVVANLQNRSTDTYWKITSVCEYGPWLYCGSVDETSIARMPLDHALDSAYASKARAGSDA